MFCDCIFTSMKINTIVVKWENIEPVQNVFNFTAPDEIVRFAESVGAKVRGHNFMWCVNLATR